MPLAVYDIEPVSRIVYTNLSILSSATITATDIINAALWCVRRPEQIYPTAKQLHNTKCVTAEAIVSEVDMIALTISYCIPLVNDWMRSCVVNENGYMMLVRITGNNGLFTSAPTLQEVTRDYNRLTNQQVF